MYMYTEILLQKASSKSSNDLGKKQKTGGPQLKFPKLLVAPQGQQMEEIEHMYIPPPNRDAGESRDIKHLPTILSAGP